MLTSPSSLVARLRMACILTVFVFCIRHGRSQAPVLQGAVPPPTEAVAAAASAYQPIGEGASVKVNFPSAPIQAIIPFYQELTGRKLILDSNLAGNPLRIISPHLLTRRDAIAYIESTLLLNGYTFIHRDATTSVLINHSANANVPAAGLPVYNSLTELPVTEEICHFVLPLNYVTATDAAKAFTEAIKPHTYGALMPVANDTALLITENSTTIRSIVRIAQIIDVPPMQTANETIKLQRADVEIVADIINEIFEKDEEGADATQPAAAVAVPAAPAGARPGMPAGTATPISTASNAGGTNRGSGKPKVIPYRRTNELIVFARPVDIAYIRSLVEKLDKQDDGDTFRKFRLRHLDVRDFLASARDTLARDTDIQSDSGGASSGGGGRRGGRSNQSVGRDGNGTDASRNTASNSSLRHERDLKFRRLSRRITVELEGLRSRGIPRLDARRRPQHKFGKVPDCLDHIRLARRVGTIDGRALQKPHPGQPRQIAVDHGLREILVHVARNQAERLLLADGPEIGNLELNQHPARMPKNTKSGSGLCALSANNATRLNPY